MGAARELKAQAEILEAKTRLQEYIGDDLEDWRRKKLINHKDKEQLWIFPGGRKTLRQAAEEYRKTWDVSTKEAKTRESRLSHIIECLGENTPIETLRHSDGEYLKQFLRDRGYKVATVNKHLQDLKRMFALQVAERAIDFNPFSAVKGMKIPAGEKIQHTIPSEEEIQLIIEKAEENDRKKQALLNGHLTLFLLLFFGCGLRLSEAMAARIENIDWDLRGLLLTETKTGKPRMVGLGQKLFSLLLPMKGQKGYILPRFRPESVSRAIRRHFNNCGVKMRLHDTRHTYTTLLQEKNVSPIDAMGRTGHSDMRMLSHYSHPKLGRIYEDQFEFMQDQKKS
ncbi:tyrosine-type recombinase/integrase [Thermodesulfobacteriota bacterium B35]